MFRHRLLMLLLLASPPCPCRRRMLRRDAA